MPAVELIHDDLVMYANKDCVDYRKEMLPDFQKPLIYVTDPDEMEDEIWVPPAHEDSTDDSLNDSDADELVEPPSFPNRPPAQIENKEEEPAIVGASEVSKSKHDEIVLQSTEVWFYRTGWQNRGVYAADDNKGSEMLYYADIPWRGWGSHLTFRKGSQSGPLIAVSHRRGPRKPFEITFPNPLHRRHLEPYQTEPKLILRYGNSYSRTHHFRYAGRNLAWRQGAGVRRLRDVDSAELIAEFTMRPFSLQRDGKMEIFGELGADELWRDVIVVTALTCQQREREIRRATAYSVADEN